MRHLRAALRLLLLAVWTTGLALCCLPGLLVAPFSRAVFARMSARVTHLWGMGMLLILGVRKQVEGDPPGRGAFAASNHLSHLDIMVLASIYPTNFIAKVEISGWPMIGLAARMGATLWINRERARDTERLGRELDDLLRKGVTITLFAEGTSGRGDAVMPFKRPLFETPAALGTPCVPVAVSYRTPGAGPGPAGPDGGDPANTVCWWGDMSFVPHYWKMLGLRRIVARVRFGDPVAGAGDRKVLAAECHRRVAALFDPIPQ